MHREQAMNILWPDSGRKAASNSLRNLTAARSQLNGAVWETTFAEAKAMGLDAAVDYALSDNETATPPSPAPEGAQSKSSLSH
jgi:hypothetical protein